MPVRRAWWLLLFLSAVACGAPSAPEPPALPEVVDLGAAQAQTLMDQTPELLVVDVRTPEEFAGGHLAGAVNVNFKASDFEAQLGAQPRNRPVLLYCRTGNRSGKSLPTFARLGFAKVYHLTGGITEWREAGLPLESAPAGEPAPPPDR